MKIKNVIFDFGQVLVHFEPEYMVGKYVENKEDAKILEEVVFDRLYWDRLDLGTISNEEVISECKKRLPERLHCYVEQIYYNWIYNIPQIDGMKELISYLKSTYHVKLCLLSNISPYFISHKDEIEILKEIDLCVFSGELQIVKPSYEIFAHLCKNAEILPQESIFIDDSAKNIEGAKAFGLHTYLFDKDASKLKSYLDSVLK